MVQMISHGLISGAMFLCIGVLYDRMHTREISAYGGVVNTMPKFAALMVLFALANSGLPGTSGFIGEFLVILASFKASFWFALLAATILVLGAAYNLWLVKRVIFGPVANEKVGALEDLNPREFLVLGVLALAVILLGHLAGTAAQHDGSLDAAPVAATDHQQGRDDPMRCSALDQPRYPPFQRSGWQPPPA